MYTYHGWFEIRDAAFFDDEESIDVYDERRDSIARLLIERIARDELIPPEVHVVRPYGDYFLVLHGQEKRDRGATGALRRLLTDLGELAPGSYGQLYIADDEFVEAWNEYRVIVMVRGELQDVSDPWFSPIVPTVEDPEPSDGGE